MATMTLIGLYNYDNTIFDNMQLPAELDFETVKNSILLNCSEFEVLYPNSEVMKKAIEFWSKQKLHSWQKIAFALYKDYNPFVNFTRDETREIDYNPNITRTRTANLTDSIDANEVRTPNLTTNTSANSNAKNRTDITNTKNVAAWNEGNLQNTETSEQGTNSNSEDAANTTTTENGTDTTKRNDTVKTTGTDTNTETGNTKTVEKFHSEGDSALFTPTDVARKEAELRTTFDMIDIIINDFKTNLVLAIY